MSDRQTAEGMPSRLPDMRAANLAENPWAGQGPVLLDIGGEIGALVLQMPASMEGLEIEIGRSDNPGDGHHHPGEIAHEHPHDHEHPHHHEGDRAHVAVVARPTGVGLLHGAVFPDLQAGDYELRERSGPVRLRVTVSGGTVTQAAWPED